MAEIEKNLEEKEEEVQEEVTVETLLKDNEKLKQENEKYYEHLQRTAAEFDNYKKRMQKEKDATYNLAVGDVVTKYISVLDNLEKYTSIFPSLLFPDFFGKQKDNCLEKIFVIFILLGNIEVFILF